MKFSLILPVYNVETYLPGCLESILANDLADCEVLLIDDGATDSSGAICDDYVRRFPGIFRVIHQKNAGIGGARNTGIASARGEWFLFIDSDDKIDASTLRLLRRAIDENPGAEVIGFQFYADNGVDPPVPQSSGATPTERPFRLTEHRKHLLDLPSSWMRLWHRRLFLDSGIRFPEKVWFEDLRTTPKLLALAEGIAILPQPLYYYLSRPGSVMKSDKLNRNREIMDALEDDYAWYREHGLFETYHTEMEALAVQHVLLVASVRVARQDPKHPLLREFRTYVQTNFPNWKKNPYIRELPPAKRLALALVTHRRYRLLKTAFRVKG